MRALELLVISSIARNLIAPGKDFSRSFEMTDKSKVIIP